MNEFLKERLIDKTTYIYFLLNGLHSLFQEPLTNHFSNFKFVEWKKYLNNVKPDGREII